MTCLRTPPEDLFHSHLHKKEMHDAFMPIVQRTFAKYTGQASDIMICANRLLDRFCYLIFRSLALMTIEKDGQIYTNQMKQTSVFGSTRFTRLRLWTQGNAKDCIDGFCNNPHVDRDGFFQSFQDIADWLLAIFKNNKLFNENDVQYLMKLRDMGLGKFQTPTVCGYDIVRKDPSDTRHVHACFALLGIRVSVRVCHCYHYFFPTSITHCTPWPITFIDEDTIATYTHDEINIIGWGGGNCSKRRNFYRRHGGPPVARLSRQNFINWLATLPQNLQIIARQLRCLDP